LVETLSAMSQVGLSSGCFIGYEDHLAASAVRCIELSGHRDVPLSRILAVLEERGIQVLSVHCPCPGTSAGLNLAATGDGWLATAAALRASFEIARRYDARYIVIHAFYCLPEGLPADDGRRIDALQRLFPAASPTGAEGAAFAEYLSSEAYQQALERAVANLASLLPELQREFPRQRLVLENLNPRVGYCGIRIADVVRVAGAFGGDVGICLDLGHLTLAARALGDPMHDDLRAARDLIWTTHVHQNFAGRFFVDRTWDSPRPHPGLQEVDVHLPLLTRYRRNGQEGDGGRPEVAADNSAFTGILEAAVQYAPGGSDEDGTAVAGAVPVEELLALLLPSANRVFELDSRYAPLAEIVDEYALACRGEHPVALW
jgi:sugar phosphate isomerase/epimerase